MKQDDLRTMLVRVARKGEIRKVGNGTLVSDSMADAQLRPHLVGFGKKDP